MDEIIVPAERTAPRSWDFFLTVFLLFVLLVLTALFLVLGFGLSVATLPCADSSEACNGLVISVGTLLATVGVGLVALAGIVVSIVFIARRRISFVVPLVACLAVGGLFVLGSWVGRAAVPSARSCGGLLALSPEHILRVRRAALCMSRWATCQYHNSPR